MKGLDAFFIYESGLPQSARNRFEASPRIVAGFCMDRMVSMFVLFMIWQ